MNRTNFNQTGGFPLKTERLDELQKSYEIFNNLGNIAGNLVILSGCNVTGSNVSDGVVVIDGEIYPFKGGYISSNVVITSTTSTKEFEEGGAKPVHTIKEAGFGTASESWPWASFIRPIPTRDFKAALDIKEDKTNVLALQTRIQTLEAALLTLQIPKIRVVSGSTSTLVRAVGYYHNDYSKNYAYVYPPAGYTMSHLAGFLPSISQINFSGDVNSDDILWCKYTTDASKITIICNNSENRDNSSITYMGVWIKY
ncbi:hypothetical protein GON26_20570 [Flavobacterium sp. GA093]|uniref:Uncharacterized protein n=1 Tax=Flavobacterium hydrocarbonoxydans TaxID=2683249 RepID=A0A6I4NRC3_9FLAO|nr:hypothetical protein [Flavobacterium hydrocarbonoxydans]MWB96763.1 hypothetical protein [Flavobacterium hydrocarbonoxydans]